MFANVLDLLDAADRSPRYGRRAAKTSNFSLPYLDNTGIGGNRGFGMQQVIHVDPNVEKGKALHASDGVLYMHPDDYAELRKNIEGKQNLSVGYKP